MTSTTTPTAVWDIVARPTARDGDSVHLLRERVLHEDVDMVLIRRDPKPVLCRAAWINTPEISGPNVDPVNGPRATQDAQEWFDAAWDLWREDGHELTVVQYGFEKYGRPLVDIRSGDQSFSQWMLQQGWAPYL